MSLRIGRSGTNVSARAIRAAAKEALEIAIEQWHGTMMPQHFTTAAPAKYGYTPRTKKYMIRKARKMHHQRPLEFTGDSKKAAMFDYRIAQTTIAGRPAAYVAMSMPGYFVKRPKSSTIDKPAELTRTTTMEEQQLGQLVSDHFLQSLGVTRVTAVA